VGEREATVKERRVRRRQAGKHSFTSFFIFLAYRKCISSIEDIERKRSKMERIYGTMRKGQAAPPCVFILFFPDISGFDAKHPWQKRRRLWLRVAHFMHILYTRAERGIRERMRRCLRRRARSDPAGGARV